MATTTHDDGFREIQLNGKQLVFLFMAATVILIVTFLTGFLVGRDMPLGNGTVAESVAVGGVELEAPPPPEGVAAGATAPGAAAADTTYADRLSGANPADEPAPPPVRSETVAETVPEPVTPPSAAAAAAEAKTPPPNPPAAAGSAPGEPAGTGIAIQIMASRSRTEADGMARRLIGKGYQAYVLAPAAGAPELYRVRVGKFKERREADVVVARLTKEEKLKPWIVR
jgi:cell division septation protein DedD